MDPADPVAPDLEDTITDRLWAEECIIITDPLCRTIITTWVGDGTALTTTEAAAAAFSL